MPKRDQPKQNRSERNAERKNGKAFAKGQVKHKRARMSPLFIMLNHNIRPVKNRNPIGTPRAIRTQGATRAEYL